MVPSRFASFASLLVLSTTVVCFAPPVCQAQLLQGTLTGNVVDSSQATVPNASVSIENQGTKLVRDTTANADGEYTLATLPPGVYTLTVRANGFAAHTQTGVRVNANEVTRVT